jgi:prepilin-type N-terminal cleavage/methylation domain-containing protein
MRQDGVTLVELMIVLLIVGLIAVAASPFTSDWVKDARVAESASALEEAIGRAKAIAMRNTAKITGDEKPASRICFSNSKISLVVPANSTQDLTCELTPVWTTTVSDVVSIKESDLDWGCSCFNNRGLVVNKNICNTCSDGLEFQFFHSGVEREKHSF